MRYTLFLFSLFACHLADAQIFNKLETNRLEKTGSIFFISCDFERAANNFVEAAKFRQAQGKPMLQANDLYFAGEAYLGQNKWDSAQMSNNKLIELLIKYTDSTFMNKAILQKSAILIQVDSLERAYGILTSLEDKMSMIQDSLLKSQINYYLGEYYKRKRLYTACEKASLNSLLYCPKEHTKSFYQSKIKLQLGSVYIALCNYKLSEKYLFEASNLIQDIPQAKLLRAKIYNDLGLLFFTINDNLKAQLYLTQSKQLLINNNQYTTKELITNQSLTASLYKMQGDYKKALECNFDLLKIKEVNYGINSIETSSTLNNIGITYYQLGADDKALEYFYRSLDIQNFHIKCEDRPKAQTINNIGLCYASKSNFNEAIKKYHLSLAIIKKLFGNTALDVAIAYHNISTSYIGLTQFDSALFYINNSLNVAKILFEPNSPKFAYSYDALAELYTKVGIQDSALLYYHKSLNIYIAQFGKQHPDVIKTYNSIAKNYLLENQPNKAINYFDSALYSNGLTSDIPKNINNQILQNISILDRNALTQSLIGLGKANYEHYKLENNKKYLLESSQFYNLSFESIELLKSDFNSEKSLLSINEMLKDDIEEVLEVDYELYTKGFIDSLDGVHQHIETIKKSALYSVLSSKKYSTNDSLENLKQYENQFYNSYQKKKLDLLLMGNTTKEKDTLSLKLNSELFSISRLLDSIFSIYKNKFPAYANLRFGNNSIALDEFKGSLKPNECLLNYFTTNQSVFVLMVTNNTQQFIKLSANLSLSDSIQLYNKSLKQFSFNEANRLNHYLYGVLIDPIYDFIKSCNNLVIIPNESLSILPFETLSKTPITDLDYKNGNYLIRDFSISYHYNATLWNLGLNSTESSYTKEFAGFAPIFSDSSESLAELENYIINPKDLDLIYRSGGKYYMSALPFSANEIGDISTLFENSGFIADRYLNQNASEATFKSASSSYRYLHIATHGLVNYDFPQLSGLIFSQNHSSDLEDDGILYAGEISNLALKTNLVVLSSCESGIGKLIKGEGMLSMSRFFYCAGVPNIMFSLWKVPDNSTNKLMIEFYTNLLENNSKPNALRNAKLKLIENPEYSFPQFWGGFVLLGN